MTTKFRRKSLYIWSGIGVLLLGIVLSAVAVPNIRQGLGILLLKAGGSLPDVGWMDLYEMLRPGRPHFYISRLPSNPNPYAVIQNSYAGASDVSAGAKIFRFHCMGCHGPEGTGGNGGPSLQQRQMVRGNSDWALFRTITDGIPGTAMPPNKLPWVDRWRLVAYVKSLMVRKEAPRKTSGIFQLEPVSYESILAAHQHQQDWLTYSGAYDGQRYSSLSQITPANVARLRLLWVRQFKTAGELLETSPLVVGGYMFVTLPPNRVEALNAKTGSVVWIYTRDLPERLSICCGYVNRGLAVLGDTLFLGTMDAHLMALDMKTGRVRWDVEIADYKEGFTITGAPLAIKNMVVTGVAGGEYGIRGFVDARDAKTGKEKWRFYTVPEPGKPGADTWEGDSWRTGGGPTWTTGSFDPQTNVIYWPTGNPSPDFNGKRRKGDNLYTDCVVALDADDGTLRWHFQFTPHDVWDWDGAEILVLFDKDVAGKRHRYLAQADRNGFYYLLDRETGRFLLAQPFAKQTWAKSIDSNGRPVVDPASYPTKQGNVVSPHGGATNWMSPSYSPLTGLIYIPTSSRAGAFYEGNPEFRKGESFRAGSFQSFNVKRHAAVLALDALTGKKQWEYTREPSLDVGGLLSTGGGVLFGSMSGRLFALDARTGRELWRVKTSDGTRAAPVTFLYDGRQMVTLASGHDIFTFGLPPTDAVQPTRQTQ